MRVVAGKAKGANLRSVPGDSTRPITDRVKRSLFDILGPDVKGSRWLDLFGGTGAVGIEALSRGAGEVHFVERSRKAIQVIKGNLEHTHLQENAVIHHDDAFSFLKHAFESAGAFDYIYVAPPQYKRLWISVLEALDDAPEWLTEEGEIIVQIHPRELEPVELRNFREFDRRKYGSTLLLFYERTADEELPQETEDDEA